MWFLSLSLSFSLSYTSTHAVSENDGMKLVPSKPFELNLSRDVLVSNVLHMALKDTVLPTDSSGA